MQNVKCTELEDFSATYENALEAVEVAIKRMKEALSVKKYKIKSGSLEYMEMRCYLPYVIHKTEIEGVYILVNRHYKPVGSNKSNRMRVVYEDIKNLHVQLNEQKLAKFDPQIKGAWLYAANSPWVNRKSAEKYLEKLRLLKRTIVSR